MLSAIANHIDWLVNGSFVVTTANAIQFGDRGFFSASVSNGSSLRRNRDGTQAQILSHGFNITDDASGLRRLVGR